MALLSMEENYVRANRSIASRLFTREKNAFYRTTAEHLDMHQVKTRFELISSLYNDVLRKHEQLMEILHSKHNNNNNDDDDGVNLDDNQVTSNYSMITMTTEITTADMTWKTDLAKEEQWMAEYEREFEKVEHRRYAIEKQIADAKSRAEELRRQTEDAMARKRDAQAALLRAHQVRIVEDRAFYFFAQTLETVLDHFHHTENNVRFMKEELRQSFER